MNRNASARAEWWACPISVAIGKSAIAHSVNTDFTGENVRTYPPTAAGADRDHRTAPTAAPAHCPGHRPPPAGTIRPLSRRGSARSLAGTVACAGSPRVGLWSVHRSRSAAWNGRCSFDGRYGATSARIGPLAPGPRGRRPLLYGRARRREPVTSRSEPRQAATPKPTPTNSAAATHSRSTARRSRSTRRPTCLCCGSCATCSV
jgi:hypothetical protein